MNQNKLFFSLLFLLFFALTISAQQEADDDYLSPVRPTVSDSGKIQKKGVLQVEYGIDSDHHAPDYRNRQIAPLGIYYAVNKHLRLDFELDTFASQKALERETGIGDVNLGFKTIFLTEPEKRLAIGLTYDVKLPAADKDRSLGTGRIDHNIRMIFDRKYGKNDFIANFGYLNVGRDDSDKRASGGQLILAYERELPKNLGAQFEIIANSINEAQPRGIYTLGALTYKISKRFVLDFGVRPGIGHDAPKFNVFSGITIGSIDFLKKH